MFYNIYMNLKISTIIKTYPVRNLKTPGKSALINFLIIEAMWPKKIELRSLTRRTRLIQRPVSDDRIRMSPTAHSARFVEANRNWHGSGRTFPSQVFFIIELVEFECPLAISSSAESSNWMIKWVSGLVRALRNSICALPCVLYLAKGRTRSDVTRSK